MARSTVRSSESETANPVGLRRSATAGCDRGGISWRDRAVPGLWQGRADSAARVLRPSPHPAAAARVAPGGASGKSAAPPAPAAATRPRAALRAARAVPNSAGGAGGGMTPTPSDPPGSKDGGASSADALEVRDGAKIEVGAPAGMPDGATAVCDDTDNDQLGPYHLKGHLMRELLAMPSDGMPLVVTGRVLNTKCEPLAGAVVDVWAANGKGVYSENPTGWARGIVIADAQGNYKYQTVYPGPYQGRPRHIHLMIAQPGHTKLTTQMYFKGENPDIPANAAPKTLVNGIWQCNFNIVLRSSTRAEAPAPQLPPAGKFHRRFWGGWNRTSKAT